ncbi:MAG: histidine kinase [Clostridia bacterium]
MKISYKAKIVILTTFCISIFLLMFLLVFYLPQMTVNNNKDIKFDGTNIFVTNIENFEETQVLLNNDWQFFYNDWIISDNINRENDGVIKINDTWSRLNKNFGRKGYASYKTTIKGVKKGSKFSFNTQRILVAYQIFLNDKKVFASGEMSKEKTGAVLSNAISTAYIAQTNEDIDVVLEMSYTDLGCYNQPLCLQIGKPHNPNFTLYGLDNIASSILLAVILMCCIIGVTTKKDGGFILLLSMIFLQFLYCDTMQETLFSTLKEGETALILRFNAVELCIRSYAYLSGVFCFALILTVLFVCVRQKYIQFTKPLLVSTILNTIAFFAIYFSCKGAFFRYFSTVPIFAFIVTINYYLCKSIINKRNFSLQMLFIVNIIGVNVLTTLFDNFGLYLSVNSLVHIILMLILTMLTLFVYLRILRENYLTAFKAIKLDSEIKNIKALSLKGQITPHFVFNTMATIQFLFRETPQLGVDAIEKFKAHLNANIQASSHSLIPFNEELLNIQNCFNLQNLRFNDVFVIEYDIEYTDFEIPILSIQPLIENCIKYARLTEVENGKIIVKTKKVNNNIVVSVSDNGCGFDTNNVSATSTGLKNVTDRMRITVNATTTVYSKIGEGTTVTITIPIRRKSDEKAII